MFETLQTSAVCYHPGILIVKLGLLFTLVAMSPVATLRDRSKRLNVFKSRVHFLRNKDLRWKIKTRKVVMGTTGVKSYCFF